MPRNLAQLAGLAWALGGGSLLLAALSILDVAGADEAAESALPLVLGCVGALLVGAILLGLAWSGARRRVRRLRDVPLAARTLARSLARPALWLPGGIVLLALLARGLALEPEAARLLAPPILGLCVLALGLALAHLLPGAPARPASPGTDLDATPSPPCGVLLLDAEEPEAPRATAVRRHLRRVLGDRLTQPRRSLAKALWCRHVIAPLRARKLAREYRRVWTAEGGPRTRADARIARALAGGLGPAWRVAVAGPREGGGLGQALDGLLAAGCQEIHVVPLLPQYSVAATGARLAELHRRLARRRLQPALHIETRLDHRQGYLAALAESARPLLASAPWDRVVFAFPGRAVVLAADPYVAQCLGTAQALARELGLDPERWALGFDEDLRGPASPPALRSVLLALAPKAPRVLLVPAGTTTDGVETLHGLAVELAAEFQRAGGRELKVAPALNDHPAFVAWLIDWLRHGERGLPAPPTVRRGALPVERV